MNDFDEKENIVYLPNNQPLKILLQFESSQSPSSDDDYIIWDSQRRSSAQVRIQFLAGLEKEDAVKTLRDIAGYIEAGKNDKFFQMKIEKTRRLDGRRKGELGDGIPF